MRKYYFSRLNKTVVWEWEDYCVEAVSAKQAELIALGAFTEYEGVVADAAEYLDGEGLELTRKSTDPPVWAGLTVLLMHGKTLGMIDKQFDIEIDPPFEAEG